ncbi:MAG: helix-turn-helix domain-containing protein, partial [Rhodocyclaceae bacterium]|nr:helix-turn-helix domain-containing protein [Rhodocyclaceae bacterium]
MTDRKLKTFGAYIRNQREAAGIPLNIFARDLGISPAYWSRIERDMEKPPQVDLLPSVNEGDSNCAQGL